MDCKKPTSLYSLSSPIVIVSPDENLRRSYAQDLAESLILQSKNAHTEAKLQSNNHPDLSVMSPEGKSDVYLMETIKHFIQDINLPPYEAKLKVYLFRDADKMLPIHANALLKTLEEKPDYAVIVLTTENKRRLLPTILSRSQVVTLSKPQTPTINPALEKAAQSAFFEAAKNNYLTLNTHIQELLPLVEESPNRSIPDVLTTLLYLVKDLEILRLKTGDKLLSYPEYMTEYAKLKIDLSFEKLSKIISIAEDAIERSMRPKTILEYLFLSIGLDG